MKSEREACARGEELRRTYDQSFGNRTLVRNLMNGGTEGARALMGKMGAAGDHLPSPNFALAAVTKAGAFLGDLPTLRVRPPRDKRDKPSHQKAAEKRERIVQGYDDANALAMQMPQIAMWTVGYGFAPLTITDRVDRYGYIYPRLEARDPFNSFPGAWGTDQQPEDIGFVTHLPAEKLLARYGEKHPTLARSLYNRGPGGAVIMSAPGQPTFSGGAGWANQFGNGGVDVTEYFDADGRWTFLADRNIVLDFIPNPLRSRAAFVVAKRFAFDRLVGQYDGIIGLQQAITQMNVMLLQTVRDNIDREMVIRSDTFQGPWRRGRNQYNVLAPGDDAQPVDRRVGAEPFQHMRTLEGQLRQTGDYPVTDDSSSPSAWITGKGHEELTSARTASLDLLRTVFAHTLVTGDALCLEYDENACNHSKPLPAMTSDPSAETYTPGKDINGRYRTERIYGAMAGFNAQGKTVVGMQMQQAKWMSRVTAMENVAEIPDVQEELQRIDHDDARTVVVQSLLAGVDAGDPASRLAAIRVLKGERLVDVAVELFTPEDPQPSPEEQAMLGMAEAPMAPSAPEPVQTVMARAMAGGQSMLGVQTVGRM